MRAAVERTGDVAKKYCCWWRQADNRERDGYESGLERREWWEEGGLEKGDVDRIRRDVEGRALRSEAESFSKQRWFYEPTIHQSFDVQIRRVEYRYLYQLNSLKLSVCTQLHEKSQNPGTGPAGTPHSERRENLQNNTYLDSSASWN